MNPFIIVGSWLSACRSQFNRGAASFSAAARRGDQYEKVGPNLRRLDRDCDWSLGAAKTPNADNELRTSQASGCHPRSYRSGYRALHLRPICQRPRVLSGRRMGLASLGAVCRHSAMPCWIYM